MMRRFLALLLWPSLLALCGTLGLARPGLSPQGPGLNSSIAGAPPAGYTGPGDCSSCATTYYMWWGLRAFSAADRGNRLVNVCDISFLNCTDMSSDATTGLLVPTNVNGTSCASQTCVVKILYDRSGANDCSAAACDYTFDSQASGPRLLLSCLSTLPCLSWASATVNTVGKAIATHAQPFTASLVASRTGAFTTIQTYMGVNTGGVQILFDSSASLMGLYAGTAVRSTAAADSAWHAMQAFGNAGSSAINIDGTDNSVSTPGSNGLTGTLTIGGGGGNNVGPGTMMEAGFQGTSTSGQRTAVGNNQKTAYGF